jgi:hypothetical protein
VHQRAPHRKAEAGTRDFCSATLEWQEDIGEQVTGDAYTCVHEFDAKRVRQLRWITRLMTESSMRGPAHFGYSLLIDRSRRFKTGYQSDQFSNFKRFRNMAIETD